MYGGYGGLGSGLGGYSSYGGLGSSYGGMGSSSYSGYGGLGGYQNRSRLTAEPTTGQKGASDDPNDPEGQKGQKPDPNKDKKVVEQWFKMMGGLRSILQLGIAFLALANFAMTTSQLMKKFYQWSKQTSQSFASWLDSKLPKKALSKMMVPERRGKILKMAGMVFLRVFAIGLLVMGARMRKDIKRENRKRQEQMEMELRELREEEGEEVEEAIEGVQLVEEEGANHDANL